MKAEEKEFVNLVKRFKEEGIEVHLHIHGEDSSIVILSELKKLAEQEFHEKLKEIGDLIKAKNEFSFDPDLSKLLEKINSHIKK